MTYKIIITNISGHEFYMASGVLPMHRIICDTYNEHTGETQTQTELFEPGPEQRWAVIQEDGYVLRYEEDKLSTEPKPGYHYRHIIAGMVIIPGNKMYGIDIPSPVLYDTEAAAKTDNTYCRFIKIKGTVHLCVFGALEPGQRAVKQNRMVPAVFHSHSHRKLIASYTYEDFKRLPFIEWQKVKDGVDWFWLEPDSFEPCAESFDDAFGPILPDITEPQQINNTSYLLVDDEAYRIVEEADSNVVI